jgi:hypothetical protein
MSCEQVTREFKTTAASYQLRGSRGTKTYFGKEPQVKCSCCSTLLTPVPAGNTGMLPTPVSPPWRPFNSTILLKYPTSAEEAQSLHLTVRSSESPVQLKRIDSPLEGEGGPPASADAVDVWCR